MAGRVAAQGLAAAVRIGGWILGTGSRSGRREEEEGEKRRKSLGMGIRTDSYTRVGGGVGGNGDTESDFNTRTFHDHHDRYASVYSATDTDIIDMTSGRSAYAAQGEASTSTSTAPTANHEQTSYRPGHLPSYHQQRFA